MNPFLLTFTLVVSALISACAPATRVTLLPEEGTKVGALEVKSATGSVTLNRAYQTAEVGQKGELQLGETTAEAVRGKHMVMLAVQAAEEIRFTLYFAEGGSRLTPESESQLAQVVQRAAERPGGEILVTGHTDTSGPAQANDALSLQRAKSIRELLMARGFKGDLIEAIGRGERELLVPTADEVNEPRNRRAEIVVR